MWTINSSLSFVDKSPRLRSTNELLIQLPNRAGLCSQRRCPSCRINSIDLSEFWKRSAWRVTQLQIINLLDKALSMLIDARKPRLWLAAHFELLAEIQTQGWAAKLNLAVATFMCSKCRNRISFARNCSVQPTLSFVSRFFSPRLQDWILNLDFYMLIEAALSPLHACTLFATA